MSEPRKTLLYDVAAAQRFLNDFPKGMRTRGKALYAHGAVRHLDGESDGTGFTAKVQANRVYSVTLFYNEDGWDAECSCAALFECDHAYAAMTALLAGQQPSVSSPQEARPSELEKRVSEQNRRKLRPEEQKLVTQLQELYLRCRAKGGMETWELNQLGFYLYGYGGWGRLELWPSFPKDDYEFWLYIAHILREHRVPIPPFLSSITDLTLIAEGLAQVRRRKEIARWQEQLGNVSSQPWHTGPSSMVDFRLVIAPEAAHLEWKLASEGSFKTLKKAVSKRFSADYTVGRLELVPEATPLWHSFFQHYHNTYRWSNEIRYADPEAKRFLNPWLCLPVL